MNVNEGKLMNSVQKTSLNQLGGNIVFILVQFCVIVGLLALFGGIEIVFITSFVSVILGIFLGANLLAFFLKLEATTTASQQTNNDNQKHI